MWATVGGELYATAWLVEGVQERANGPCVEAKRENNLFWRLGLEWTWNLLVAPFPIS